MRRKFFLAMFALGLTGTSTAALATCPALPNSLTNGQVADASQVMANFNQLETCLNSGAAVSSLGVTGAGGGIADIQNPSGTINYNFNLPTTAGTVGQVLVSGGGGSSPMTWVAIPGATLPPLVDGIPVGRPSASALAWRNPGTASYAEYTNGPITILIPPSSGDQIRGLEQAVPSSTPYTLTVKIDAATWNKNYYTFGIYVIDSSGKLITLNEQEGVAQVQNWNSISSFGSTQKSVSLTNSSPIWMRINNNGSLWSFFISRNGADWISFYSESLTSFIGTPVAIGVYGDNNDTTGIGLDSRISIWSFELASGSGTNSHW